MKAAAGLVFLAAIGAPGPMAQSKSPAPDNQTGAFCKKLERDSQYFVISPVGTEKLLIQKAEPVWKHRPMEARVSGTVGVQFELGKHGEVLCPKIISGPKILQQPVLDAVRKYMYKPNLLNGEAVVVSTTVWVPTSNF
jgi:hypothetical protein